MTRHPDSCDVMIIGGGLAGLSLALQIRQKDAALEIVVVERLKYPVPVAAHKVGESTVEIAAHYFANTLGLNEHLENEHLRKFGLRFFFGGPEPGMDMAGYDEIGASDFLPITSYQIDRGLFENHLAERARTSNIQIIDGATVEDLRSENGRHEVTVKGPDQKRIRSRWLVDASGRKAFLKRQMGLQRPTAHRNCSVWLRTSATLDIDEWGTGGEWCTRCGDRPRRLSTNHMMGPGYWVWLIPLSSGATSVGLVFDPDLVNVRDVNRYDCLLSWLKDNQPVIGMMMEDQADNVMDFHVLRGYPHSCRRVFSKDQWAITGDAGVFTDPFYSPGSDFIAISNTYITDLIVNGITEGPGKSNVFQQVYFSFFSSTLALFNGQYPGFGDRDLMFAKTVWDYAYYWAVLAKLFFAEKITDVAFIENIQEELLYAIQLNNQVQKCFQTAGAKRRRLPAQGLFLDHYKIPWFFDLKQQLIDGDGDHRQQLTENIARLDTLAGSLKSLVSDSLQGRPLPQIRDIPGL